MDPGTGGAAGPWDSRSLASPLRPAGDPRCAYRPSSLPHAPPDNMRGQGVIAPPEQQTLPNLVNLLQAAEPSSAAKRRLPALDSDNAAEEHGKRPRTNARTSRTYPRRRALVACEICRARKTKCDNQRPSCGSCLSLGCSCSYADASADHSSFDPASLAILERLNYAVSLLESQANQPQTPAVIPAQPPIASNTAIDETAHEIEILELSVPSSMSAAHLLEWPIFGNKYDRKYLNAALFEHSPCTTAFDGDTGSGEVADAPDAQSAQRSKMPSKGIQKEEVHDLIQAFLENVHTKNPVLDSTDLKRWATPISEHGFGWSSRSCLLLIVCALGALSAPFQTTQITSAKATSLSETENYTTAETYYTESRKRIGLLGTSLIAAQCSFLSGIYEMYSLRPLQAWTSFSRAAGVIHVYRIGNSNPTTPRPSSTLSLEHRLYWSCLKSISEIREQLPLPPSGLASLDCPLFPTLPGSASETRDPPLDNIFEKSWFYYLAEISSRRISNRILNAFYKGDHNDWLSSDLESMIGIAHELESQIEQWSQHIQRPVGYAGVEVPQEELAFMIRVREIYMYTLLYRPFLFLATHNQEVIQRDPRVQVLAEKCLRNCFHISSSVGIKHRHHGTYFVGRGLFSIGLIILATVKTGRLNVPSDWRRHMDHILAFLEYWELESPDLARGRAILQETSREFGDVYA